MEETISKIKSIIQRGLLKESDIYQLLGSIRVLIEEEKTAGIFPHLYMYATWLAHSELHRNPTCLKVLVELTRVFSVNDPISKNLKGPQWIEYLHRKINAALGLPDFRNEMIRILDRLGFTDSSLNHNNGWKDFVLILISCLYERPIKLPDTFMNNRIAKDTHSSIQELSKGDPGKQIVELSFIHRSKLPLPISQPSEKIEIYWRLRTTKGSLIIGPLQII